MARGWESKSVEDQMATAEADRGRRAAPRLSSAERDRRARAAGLLLSRARIVRDLDAARDARYRALLQLTLEHVDAELQRVE